MQSETCSVCNEEIRFGIREGAGPMWLHQASVDHHAVLGRRLTAEDFAEIERQKNLERTMPDGTTYTTADFDRARMSKKKRDALDAEEDIPTLAPLEPVEVSCMPMPLKGELEVAGRTVKVPGGARTVINLAAKTGWSVDRLTYSRGPYLGAGGKSLGISDSVVLVVSGPEVDGRGLQGVASWRDGKSDWAWIVENKTVTRIGVKALTTRMKESLDG